MAKYDFGGGCPCGLYKICECGQYDSNNREIPVKKNKEKLMGLFETLIAETNNEFAGIVEEGIAAGDVSGYVDTGSYALNALLSGSIYGGLPKNKVTAIAGEPSVGKTYYAIGVCKQFLEDNPNGMVFYFESESGISKATERRQHSSRFNSSGGNGSTIQIRSDKNSRQIPSYS